MRLMFKMSLGILIFVGLHFLTFKFVFPSRTVEMSEILSEIETFLQRLNAADIQTNYMLNSDPFEGLVNEVRPIVNELASLMAQTEIYEKMERIPSGPTTFIQSSTATLEKLASQVLSFESRYRLIVAEMNRNMSALGNTDIPGITHDFERVLVEPDDDLQDFKIFTRAPEDDKEPIRMTSVSIYKVLHWLKQLKTSFRDLEKLFPGVKLIDLLKKKLDIKITTQEEMTAVLSVHDIILKHGETTFSHIAPIYFNTIRAVQARMEHIFEHQNKRKQRYEDLAFGVDLDITSTKERIKNLAKPAPKKSEL